MKTGLFFGSFNPIHIGHLILANHILEFSNLNEIWFVVSPQNPFKEKKTLLNDYQRLHIARLAIEQGKNLVIRQEIINKINDLSQVSDNIGAAIKKLVELQAQWKATGAVSPHKYKENQADYSKAIEEFNYNFRRG